MAFKKSTNTQNPNSVLKFDESNRLKGPKTVTKKGQKSKTSK